MHIQCFLFFEKCKERKSELQTIENTLVNTILQHKVSMESVKYTMKHHVLMHQNKQMMGNCAAIFEESDFKFNIFKNYLKGGVLDSVSHKERSIEIETSDARFLKSLFSYDMGKTRNKYDDVKLTLRKVAIDSKNHFKNLLEDRELKCKEQIISLNTVGKRKLHHEEMNFEEVC
jgi:hypothetical protein